MTDERKVCACCGGGRKVLSILNEVRPRSRCDGEAFDAWAKPRRSVTMPIEYRPLGEEKR